MTPIIKEISAADTWPIRHQVMWPHQPFAFIQLPNDEQGLHYGLFLDKKLISVISLFLHKEHGQFRKFATLGNHQGKGYGSQLLHHIIGIAKNKALLKIWCNARIEKAAYYEKFGLSKTAKRFSKKGMDYVVMERVLPMFSPYRTIS